MVIVVPTAREAGAVSSAPRTWLQRQLYLGFDPLPRKGAQRYALRPRSPHQLCLQQGKGIGNVPARSAPERKIDKVRTSSRAFQGEAFRVEPLWLFAIGTELEISSRRALVPIWGWR
jgi:hypothetical protein